MRNLKHVGSLIESHGESHGGCLIGSFGREFDRKFGREFGREFGIEPWRVLSIELISMCYGACMKHTTK